MRMRFLSTSSSMSFCNMMYGASATPNTKQVRMTPSAMAPRVLNMSHQNVVFFSLSLEVSFSHSC